MQSITSSLASIARRSKLTSDLGYKIVCPEGLMNTITSRKQIGTNVYEKDWDLLILLDGCRVDALEELKPEYEIINNVNSLMSVGSNSREWTTKTFTEDYINQIQNTIYVSTNPRAYTVLEQAKEMTKGWPEWSIVSGDEFQHIDHVWYLKVEQIGPAHPEGTDAPDIVTDRAIQLGRTHDFDRMIVHYTPPHHPYVATAIEEDRELQYHEKHPFQALRDGVSKEKVWEAYLNDVRFGLDWIEHLLNNIDAPRAIISADHGTAFGEYGPYGHDQALLDPNVKIVPWVETTASDSQDRRPEIAEPKINHTIPDSDNETLRRMDITN